MSAMIGSETSKKILTLGCDFQTTKGGISTVIGSYSRIYKPFRFLSTSHCKGRIRNILVLLYAIIVFCFKCTKPSIKIIHIHTASNNSFKRKSIFINIAHFFKKKIVLHVHGGAFKEYVEKNWDFVSSTISKVDIIVALSNSWKSYFEEKFSDTKTIVVPNIVEDPQPFEANKKDKTIVEALFLGLICDNKGIFDLVETIHHNRTYLEGKFKLHIGGNGETARLCKYIEKHELSKIISFEGWVDSTKKALLFSNCDVFILPSYIEGVPISILEAMTYRLPIISTNVGGIPEIVKHNENGYLHNPGEKEKLFEYMKAIVENKEKNKQMGDASYEKVKPHLPKNVSQTLEDIYKNLIK